MTTVNQEADALIHGERQESYGHALDEYTRVAGMVNAAFASKIKTPFTADDMLTFMVFMKLSRHVNDPLHRDSMTDACGYVGLMEEIELERKRRERSTASYIKKINDKYVLNEESRRR